jgi:uncharacterized membrane protein (DUF485 family)
MDVIATQIKEATVMNTGFWPAVVIIVFVIAWVISKVLFYARKSEEQWRKVDKSKLKDWDDDEW